MRLKRSMVIALLLTTPGAAMAQGKVSAVLFGDLYYVAASHDSTLEDQNGLWFRRIYITYDHKLPNGFSARARLDAGSAGDFSSSNELITVIKDAWLRWGRGRHSALIGLQPPPALQQFEDSWGYRSIEKTPIDLHKLCSSRDMGIRVTGDFGENRIVGYDVMVGNGAGTKDETDEKKKVMAALRIRPADGLVLEGYVDYEDRVGSPDRRTLHAFAAYEREQFRVGGQFIDQKRNTVGRDVELTVVSGFAAARVWDRAAAGEGETATPAREVWLVARVDRSNDPNPDGPKISYLPFEGSVPSTFVLFGVDFRVTPNVSLIPNVEVVSYDEPDGGGRAPDTDIMARMTFSAAF